MEQFGDVKNNMTKEKLIEKQSDLERQREQLQNNIIAVGGALQLIAQLIREEAQEAENGRPDQDT